MLTTIDSSSSELCKTTQKGIFHSKFSVPKEANEKAGEALFTAARSDRIRGNGL